MSLARELAEQDPAIVEFLSDVEEEEIERRIVERITVNEASVLSLDDTLIVSNFPVASADKAAKMLAFVKQVLNKALAGHVATTYDVQMPLETDGSSLGFAVVRFESVSQAALAKICVDGFKVLRTNLVAVLGSEFEACVHVDETVRVPEVYMNEKSTEWYTDHVGHEQLFVVHGNTASIFWVDTIRRLQEFQDKQKKVRGAFWSPKGTYFCTMHRPGLALWTSNTLEDRRKLEHFDVIAAEFSPNEEFAVSWNSKTLFVWNIFTSEVIRTLTTPKSSVNNDQNWPFVAWSGRGDQLAIKSELGVVVYNLPAFEMLQTESGEPYIVEKHDVPVLFSFAPKAGLLAVFYMPVKGLPARLRLVDTIRCREVATKTFYLGVKDVEVVWQSEGDYLALNITREKNAKGKKKPIHNQLEIVRICEKGCPVDSLAFEEIAEVKQVAWEPRSSRFAVVLPKSINFYALSKRCETKVIQQLVSHDMDALGPNYNQVSWSPHGRFLVLYVSDKGEGDLLFGRLDATSLHISHQDRHGDLNCLQWDPSGRFVATATKVGYSAQDIDTMVTTSLFVWTFQGRLLESRKFECIRDVHWRPHPDLLVTEADKQSVLENLDAVAQRFEKQDQVSLLSTMAANSTDTQAAEQSFQKLLDKCVSYVESHPLYEEWETAWDTLQEARDYTLELAPYEKLADAKKSVAV
ncbi:MAG: uncharacterized protein KVP18_003399 [Porospora cf. gigantea A]|uniref:uncharacterized protein n=1 Tax=Porospora cf. gigantea A TaxID=2853593 RepID=UPI003559BCAD|nr:MAG: hypothetical protein KVP18_003399 [Porospora cf. gigantea A]